jgi:acyl-CoA synthetase (AMP-forming)/AMP-acid ligase II
MEFVPPPTGPILPSLLKYRLQHKPDDIFTVFPGDNGTLSSISYRELGRACRRFAHAMNMYSLTHCVEVVGLLLVCDTLLYQTAICSLAQMGITVRSN